MAILGLIDLTVAFGILLVRTEDRLHKLVLMALWAITATLATVGVPA